VVYHNLGVGGANFNALLQQRFFVEHYKLLKPDLVILDWGTNDIIYKNAVAPDHARKVIRTIQRIRAVDPHVSILLTSVQDMNYRRRNVTAAAEYAKLMREIAREQNCLFFDWYRTSGGPDTMRLWWAAKLSSKDNIHLNGRGYRKRGEALADALFATLNALEVTPSLTSLVRAAAPQNSSGLLLTQTENKTPRD
jgi:lysophospholipase L1-like esterase